MARSFRREDPASPALRQVAVNLYPRLKFKFSETWNNQGWSYSVFLIGCRFRGEQLYYSKLNALRGAAAFFVAAFHYILPYGALNSLIYNSAIFVDLFFVLSGFVIYKGYQQSVSDRVINAGQFAFLRLARLYPVHFVILLVWLMFIGGKILVASRFGLGDPQYENTLVWPFFENLFLINAYGISGELQWNYPTWSVSAELFAYLAFFIFLIVFRKAGDSARPLVFHAVLISVSCYLALYVIGLYEKHPTLVYRHASFGFLRGAAGFFAGVALAQLDPGRFVKRRGFLKDTLAEAGLVAIALWLVSISNDSFVLQVVTVAAFVVVIGFFSGLSQGLVSRFLDGRAMQYFGRISYSFYLWHVIVYLFMTDVFQFVLGFETNAENHVAGEAKWLVMGLSFTATCIVSTITFRLIEEPVRLWSKKVVRNRLRIRRGSGELEAA